MGLCTGAARRLRSRHRGRFSAAIVAGTIPLTPAPGDTARGWG